MAKLAIQLFSCKDATKTDYLGTLKKVAEIGYEGVEFAGYGDIPADVMKKTLNELGLVACGAHVPLDELKNNLDFHIEFNKIVGSKYIICPVAKFENADDLELIKEDMAKICARASEHGLVVGFHNHAVEFEKFDGKYALDIILSGDDRLVCELDYRWSEFAGIDTVEYLKKNGKKVQLIHLQDMRALPDGSYKGAVYGEGVIDNKTLVDAANKYCDPKWFVIEWEGFDMDCFEAVKRCYENYNNLIK